MEADEVSDDEGEAFCVCREGDDMHPFTRFSDDRLVHLLCAAQVGVQTLGIQRELEEGQAPAAQRRHRHGSGSRGHAS